MIIMMTMEMNMMIIKLDKLLITTCTSDKTCASQDQLGNGRSASGQMDPEQGSEDENIHLNFHILGKSKEGNEG